MRRLAVPGLVAVLAVALVGLLVFGVLQTTDDSSLDQAVASGEQPVAGDARLGLLDGSGTAALADHRGGVVVLNFFASWCGPCDDEAPVLERLQRRLDRDGSGTVVGVAVDDARDDTAAFVEKHGITFPVVRDVERELARQYALLGLPETFVIDGEGRVVALQRNAISQEWVDEQVAPLLSRAQ